MNTDDQKDRLCHVYRRLEPRSYRTYTSLGANRSGSCGDAGTRPPFCRSQRLEAKADRTLGRKTGGGALDSVTARWAPNSASYSITSTRGETTSSASNRQ